MTDTVDVRLVHTRLPADTVAWLATLLDDDERRRADSMSDAGNRRRFVVAHAALRLVVAARAGVPAGELRWNRGPHGKPSPVAAGRTVEVSLSHSGEFAAIALTDGRRVGVDLQQLAAGVDPNRMAGRWYPPAEARFVAAATDPADRAERFGRLWARKEACVKVAGGRLVPGLALPVLGASPVPTGPYLVHDLDAPPGFVAAVAVDGTDEVQVCQRWWNAPAARPLDPLVPDTLAVQRC